MNYQSTGTQDLQDKDVTRLDEKIAASEERGRLRLEAILERIEGKFALVTAANETIQRDLSEIKQSQSGNRNVVLAVLVPLIIASVLALGGLFVGTKQVWEMGVQTGQTIQASPPSTAKTP
jgi:hypothetical protein